MGFQKVSAKKVYVVFSVLHSVNGQKLKGSFYRGSFRKGVRVPSVPGGWGLGTGSGGWGGGFVVANEGKGWGGWGVGWEQAKEPASQCAHVCQSYPFANYPLVSP